MSLDCAQLIFIKAWRFVFFQILCTCLAPSMILPPLTMIFKKIKIKIIVIILTEGILKNIFESFCQYPSYQNVAAMHFSSWVEELIILLIILIIPFIRCLDNDHMCKFFLQKFLDLLFFTSSIINAPQNTRHNTFSYI